MECCGVPERHLLSDTHAQIAASVLKTPHQPLNRTSVSFALLYNDSSWKLTNAMFEPLPLSLLGQREPRPIPTVSTIEAPPNTPRDAVRDLVC